MTVRPARVVITGSTGVVGGVLMQTLAGRYEMTGVDRIRRRGTVARKADLSRLPAAERVLAGADVVVALACDGRADRDWQNVQGNDIPVLVNTLEAARRVGARRVIVASSNWVMAGYHEEAPYAGILAGNYEGLTPGSFRLLRVDDPVRPVNPYGFGKAIGETVSRWYTERYGLSVICLRLGTVTRSNVADDPCKRASLLSHRDLTQLVERCIEAPEDIRFATFFGVSNNRWRIWDIADAREAIGYEPCDDGARDGRVDSAVTVVVGMLQALEHLECAGTGNRLKHSLRTATLAERAGAGDELVVAALCHDIGSAVTGRRHGVLSAEIIGPFVHPETAWVVSVHTDFTETHRARGLRRLRRYRHRLHRHYGLAKRFADEWDVGSQDLTIDALPLEHFRPVLQRVLSHRVPRRTWKGRLFSAATKPLPRLTARRLEGLLKRPPAARLDLRSRSTTLGPKQTEGDPR